MNDAEIPAEMRADTSEPCTPPLKVLSAVSTKLAYTVEEAASDLSVCAETVRREIARGELRAFKIGRVWRVRVVELNNYMRRREAEASGERA